RERDRVAEAEPVELERGLVATGVVDLVREQEDGLVRLAENLRDLLVARRHPDPRVDDEQDEVGLRDRGPRLLGDRARDRGRVGDVDAAGVDQPELGSRPLADELLAVARDAGGLVYDRGPRAGQAVDERRLADVREADHGNRPGHPSGHRYAAARARTSRSMRSTTSPTVRCVVSISSASSAGRIRA